MRIPLSWLQEYVAVDVPADRLRDLLSMSGTKVEAVHRPGQGVRGIVVAKVLEVLPHPNADNLTLVDIEAAGGETERVVCGARNFAAGDLVAYAPVGAELPGMTISERKIRGQVSRGMLCSARELGLGKDHSGLLVLPPDAPLGDDVAKVLDLDDVILELEITPNRPDCLGMIGVAREVSALLGNELVVPATAPLPQEGPRSPVVVEVRDPEGCPRYVARYIEEVSVGAAPTWMAARLLAAGVRPISNVVDVTNYVMLETGQPLHAFDAARVADARIVVRRALKNERLVTLDGEDRELHPDDLVIADTGRALALAGVMGGSDSEVAPSTTAVILESANFASASISYTSRRHALRTEASARFERGADPEATAPAAARTCELLANIAGAQPSEEVADARAVPPDPRVIALRPQRTSELLGTDFAEEEQVRLLAAVGIRTSPSDGALEASVPTWRPDLKREVDLVEEVARLAGYDRIPATLPAGARGGLTPAQTTERVIRRVLAGAGLWEAWTSSLVAPSDHDLLGLPADHPARAMVELANPMTEESAMRTSLLPGLLRSVARNHAHGIEGVALFEIARVYEPRHGPLPAEADVIGAVMSGPRRAETWRGPEVRWDFFAASGVLTGLADALGIAAPALASSTGMPFHPTRAAVVTIGERPGGVLGELHPEVCDRFDVPEGAVAFEIALVPLIATMRLRPQVEEPPRLPATLIDVAIVVDEHVPAARVASVIADSGAPEIGDMRLFDVYRGSQVEAGRKSLAFALQLRHPDRTMTDAEALAVRDRIVAAVEREVGGTLRT